MTIAQNLKRQYDRYEEEYRTKALEVLSSGRYILGRETELFEREWAAYVGTSCCVGLASGLDALWIGFKLLGIGPGDEVIVCGNAYIACVMGITINGATPVFAEPDACDELDPEGLEALITPRTKAILAVHLYGQPCDMTALLGLARRRGLFVVEDCAQSHGARWDGQMTGSFGDLACFSFYPTKNLGAFGDAGCITTNREDLAERCRMFRNYGSRSRYEHELVGANSRLDELQAGLLRVKLGHLEELNEERRVIAGRYLQELRQPLLTLPRVRPQAEPVWHQFVVHVRDGRRGELMDYLSSEGIETLIHYPVPPHLTKAYASLGLGPGSLPRTERCAREVLSLPIFNGMTSGELDYVISRLNAFTPKL